MKKIMLLLILTMLFSNVNACIGNPNGISLKLDSINLIRMKDLCQTEISCKFNNDIIYLSNNLAVGVSEQEFSVQIPLKNGKPSFEFSDWSNVFRTELSYLQERGVIDLTDEDINVIVSSQLLSPGAILSYRSGGVDVLRTLTVSDSATYCGAQPVELSELSELNQRIEKSFINLIFGFILLILQKIKSFI